MMGTHTVISDGTERLCLLMESPPWRTRSIVGGKSIPWEYPGVIVSMNEKGGDNEKST
jgi:hypothetical protein